MEFIAVEDGAIKVDVFLNSDERVELEIFLKAGEDARKLVHSLFERENLPICLIDDVLISLTDVFLFERRKQKVILPPAISQSEDQDIPNEETTRWRDYSRIFDNSYLVNNLKGLEEQLQIALTSNEEEFERNKEESQTRQLIEMQNAVNSEIDTIQELVQKHLEENDNLENDYNTNQENINQDYWDFVNRQDSETLSMSEVSTQAAQNTIKTYSYLKHMEFYFGAISKKKFRCVVAVTPDMCDVPRSHKSVPVQKKRSIMAVDPTAIEGSVKSAGSDVEEAVLQYVHPENIYRKNITALIVPCGIQNGSIQIAPEIIRKAESSPEFHFEKIRTQIEELNKLEHLSGDILVTRHSNLEASEVVMHVLGGDIGDLKKALRLWNRNGVNQAVIPINEWEGDIVRSIKGALFEIVDEDDVLNEIIWIWDSPTDAHKLFKLLNDGFSGE